MGRPTAAAPAAAAAAARGRRRGGGRRRAAPGHAWGGGAAAHGCGMSRRCAAVQSCKRCKMGGGMQAASAAQRRNCRGRHWAWVTYAACHASALRRIPAAVKHQNQSGSSTPFVPSEQGPASLGQQLPAAWAASLRRPAHACSHGGQARLGAKLDAGVQRDRSFSRDQHPEWGAGRSVAGRAGWCTGRHRPAPPPERRQHASALRATGRVWQRPSCTAQTPG